MVAGLKLDERWSDVISVLSDTRMMLARADNDFSWSSWNNGAAAVAEIEMMLQAAHDRRLDVKSACLLYAPTGSIQEVAESSGWGVEFVDLAYRYERVCAKF